MDACLVSNSGLEPWATPTGVFNGGLQVPASFLELSWTHSYLDFLGGSLLGGYHYWISLIGLITLHGTILWIQCALMKYKVRLEN